MSDPAARERALFDAALDLPESERAVFLRDACGEDTALHARLARLLRVHEHAAATPSRLVEEAVDGIAELEPGTTIGPYTIERAVGTGGMGAVYLARQRTPVDRHVALKIVKLGMDTREVIARFAAERQALARMNHPNIAQIHDAGTTETGRPYFVMEYVEGLPITSFADAHRLDTKRRIELFLRVCDAVQHAHTKGVIHRDLKPSNILVAEGVREPVVKVIDFGIAKATSGGDAEDATQRPYLTEIGRIVGTPAYMSPEQALGDQAAIDTRTDVYSLGVVLYELLSGTLPIALDRAGSDVLRAIREAEPRTPASNLPARWEDAQRIAEARGTTLRDLRRLLGRETEWITLRALEKEPARRYQSVEAFAEDLTRMLRGEPVEAGPPSELYRLRKVVARHRVAFAFAATVFVLLAALAITGFTQARLIAAEATRANEQADLARQRAEAEREAREAAASAQRAAEEAAADAIDEAEKARLVTAFVDRMLTSANPTVAKGRDITVREVLDVSSVDVTTGVLGAKPSVEAAVRRMLGRSYQALGIYDRAADHLEVALASARSEGSPRDLAEALVELAISLSSAGRLAEADAALAEASPVVESLTPPDTELEIRLLENLSSLRYVQQRLDEAERIQDEVLAITRARKDEDPIRFVMALEDAAFFKLDARSFEAADALLAEALETLEASGADRTDLEIQIREERVRSRTLQFRGHEALAESESVVALARSFYPPDHPVLASVLATQVPLLRRIGRADDAERIGLESLRIRRTRLGAHIDTATAIENLAGVYAEQGRFEEARTLMHECIAMRREVLGPDSVAVAAGLSMLAWTYRGAGLRAEAEATLREALATWSRSPAPDHLDVATSLRNLALLLLRRGVYDEAIEHLRHALRIRQAAFPAASQGQLEVRDDLIHAYLDAERYDEALALIDDTREATAHFFKPTSLYTLVLDIQRGAAVAAKTGRFDGLDALLEGWPRLEASGIFRESKRRVAERLRQIHALLGDEEGERVWAAKRDEFDD
jgi:serine/threonine protein kinase